MAPASETDKYYVIMRQVRESMTVIVANKNPELQGHVTWDRAHGTGTILTGTIR